MDTRQCGERAFIWNPRWASPLDSPWSVYFKFIYANHVRTEQFIQLSGKLQSTRTSGPWGSVDWTDIDSILGTNVNLTWNEFISKLIHPFIGLIPEEKLLRSNVHFCARCLELGFHSPYHQSIFVERCPFHNTRLIPGCPECLGRISFAPTDLSFYPHFACKCGYQISGLASKFSFSYIWPQADKLTINDKNLGKWLALSPSVLDWFRRNVWVHPQRLVNEGLSVLGDIADILPEIQQTKYATSQYPIQRWNASKAYMWIQSEFHTNKSQKDHENSVFGGSQEVTYELRQVFKSVIRYVRRHMLKNHHRCLMNIVRGKPGITPCPVAVAYVLTRMLIEGYPSPRDVDNGKPSYRRKSNLPFYSAVDHSVLATLNSRHSDVELGHLCGINELKTVLGHLVIARFREILSQALATAKCDHNFPFDSIDESKIVGIDIVIALGGNGTLYVKDA